MTLDPEWPLKLSALERDTLPEPPDQSVKGLESKERAGDWAWSLYAPDAHSGYKGFFRKAHVPLAWSSARKTVDRLSEDLEVSLPSAVPKWGLSQYFLSIITKEEFSLDLVLVLAVRTQRKHVGHTSPIFQNVTTLCTWKTMPSTDPGPCREAETCATCVAIAVSPASAPAFGPLLILLFLHSPWLPGQLNRLGSRGKTFGVQNLQSPGIPWLCTPESCLPPSHISCRVPLSLLSYFLLDQVPGIHGK